MPRCEKTGLRVFDHVRHKPACAATEDGSEEEEFSCTIRVAKTKALISFAVTAISAKMICVFVFTYADCKSQKTNQQSVL